MQNSKFKIQNVGKDNFELINSGYKPPPKSLIWWSSISGGYKPPLIVFNFELIIFNLELF